MTLFQFPNELDSQWIQRKSSRAPRREDLEMSKESKAHSCKCYSQKGKQSKAS